MTGRFLESISRGLGGFLQSLHEMLEDRRSKHMLVNM
jgi:hypothetical protein